jgi:hypothetical protein
MKKSELKSIIKECVEEVLTEKAPKMQPPLKGRQGEPLGQDAERWDKTFKAVERDFEKWVNTTVKKYNVSILQGHKFRKFKGKSSLVVADHQSGGIEGLY